MILETTTGCSTLVGGAGFFLRAILQHHPTLEATLFELPHIATLARQRLTGTSVTKQVNIVEGDFFLDPLPTGYDLVIVAHVMHMFSPEHNLTLLRRLRAHVSTDARLLLVDFWTDTTHTQPLFAALMAGEFLVATGEGDVYSEEEVRVWLSQSGWQPFSHQPLSGPSSLIVAEAH